MQLSEVVMRKIVVGHEHLEIRVEGEESLEQILLVPEPELVDNPFAAVIERERDVVHMHDNTRLETRQHLQEQIVDVSADFHCVGAVDKQNVARLELRKKFYIDILNFFLN